MAVDLTVPDWLKDEVALWARVLELTPEWTIEVEMSMAPDGDPSNRGLHSTYGNLNYSMLTFRADIQDDEDGYHTVVHELLHVRHVRIDFVLRTLARPELPGNVSDMVERAYTGALEPYIERMSKVLVKQRSVFAAPLLKQPAVNVSHYGDVK